MTYVATNLKNFADSKGLTVSDGLKPVLNYLNRDKKNVSYNDLSAEVKKAISGMAAIDLLASKDPELAGILNNFKNKVSELESFDYYSDSFSDRIQGMMVSAASRNQLKVDSLDELESLAFEKVFEKFQDL